MTHWIKSDNSLSIFQTPKVISEQQFYQTTHLPNYRVKDCLNKQFVGLMQRRYKTLRLIRNTATQTFDFSLFFATAYWSSQVVVNFVQLTAVASLSHWASTFVDNTMGVQRTTRRADSSAIAETCLQDRCPCVDMRPRCCCGTSTWALHPSLLLLGHRHHAL